MHWNCIFHFSCHLCATLTQKSQLMLWKKIFHVQLSQPGSNDRQYEARILSYWRGYLLYVECIIYDLNKKWTELSLHQKVRYNKTFMFRKMYVQLECFSKIVNCCTMYGLAEMAILCHVHCAQPLLQLMGN